MLLLRGGSLTLRARALGQQRSLHRASIPPSYPPPPIAAALDELYCSGTGHKRRGLGQKRVVAVTTGGGGALLQYFLAKAGASSCLLEAVVPYEKRSCLSFLASQGRQELAAEVGFCSAEMGVLLAAAAKDRALSLTPELARWPDCVGVACTATIVSYYTRRGDYRAHAAGVPAAGDGAVSLSHLLVKGAREREGEDAACANLAIRALAEAAGLSTGVRGQLAEFGVRLSKAESPELELVNAVGERAEGVEEVPEVQTVEAPTTAAAVVRIPKFMPGAGRGFADVVGETVVTAPPASATLPVGSLVVPCFGGALVLRDVNAALALDALAALGREGFGSGTWAEPPAPVFFYGFGAGAGNKFLRGRRPGKAAKTEEPATTEAPRSRAAALELLGPQTHLTNWAVLEFQGEELRMDVPFAPVLAARIASDFPRGCTVVLKPTVFAALIADQAGRESVLAGVSRGLTFCVGRGDSVAGEAAEKRARGLAEALPEVARSAVTWLSDKVAGHFAGDLRGLDDGSPSTAGVAGRYVGGWRKLSEAASAGLPGLPEGRGRMEWENGITYVGQWQNGKYHGYGAKLYSKGGGYIGEWVDGKREGWGCSIYDGKWGYDRWEGPFVNDKPHGKGTMYRVDDPAELEFSLFDANADGKIVEAELVGRLCGKFGATRAAAEELFLKLDVDGDGAIDVAEFRKHFSEIRAVAGTSFPRHPDQRPVFEFRDGEPVDKSEDN
eukprot:Hpha_TRINITY_DN30884_c0_g1::TRINITY_DN30884_c0_g1_i1::g.155608::m.155608